jgi:hypothetical protein
LKIALSPIEKARGVAKFFDVKLNRRPLSVSIEVAASRMDVGRPEGFNFFERLLIHHFIPRGLSSSASGLPDRMKLAGVPASTSAHNSAH